MKSKATVLVSNINDVKLNPSMIDLNIVEKPRRVLLETLIVVYALEK